MRIFHSSYEAGPSRPSARVPPSATPTCQDDQCPYLSPPLVYIHNRFQDLNNKTSKYGRLDKRQGSSNTLSSSISTTSTTSGIISSNDSSSTSSTYAPLLTGSPSPSAAYPSSSISSNDSSSYDSSSSDTSSSSSSSSSKSSLPWTTRTKTTDTAKPSSTVYVPGVFVNITLGGDSESEAVYKIQMGMGHTGQVDSRRAKRKNPDWDGDDLQMMSLQVDLGSSDLWVASDLCTSSDCSSAPALFNTSLSLDSGQSANWTYESGAVSGEIFWEEMALGNFTIGYQAFVAAQTVTQEDLSGGAFSGVLGLALPANSFILKQIPGTTGSSADGATFLDNLFGLGSAAPTERLFSLSLERREDVRTSSFLGIGTTFDTYCPKPCSPPSSPIVAQPQLGVTGYTHWRIQLQSITATTWSDPQHGLGGQVTTVTLGASQVDTSKSTPLAVLDSGGVQILVGYKPFADSIYSIYGIQASSDGIYRLPCTQQLALTFTFAETEYSVHPLDMSWADSADPSQQTCIGAIQYSSTLGSTGDFILGSSFLKNVYSIFQYPDTMRTTVWQPSVGLVSLTNASLASQEFYAVRSLHQSLSSISANHQTTSPSSPLSPSSSPGSSSSHSASKAVVPAVVSVLGFFLVAAGLFCAWWFWLRHKWGAGGVVQYKQAPNRHRGDLSISSLRSKKHNAAQRQKSMVEGLSDYEDSWASGTGTEGESIRLGYLPETVATEVIVGHRNSAGSSVRINNGVEGDDSLIDLNESDPNSTSIGNQATVINTRRTSANRTISFHDADPDVPSPPVINPYSQPGYTSKQTGPYPEINPRRSMNMSGPFPSPAVRGQSGSVRPDSSPMYDIRSSDYFEVPRGRTRSSVTGGSGGNRGNSQQGREGSRGRSASGGRRLSPGKQTGSVLGQVLVEEPEAG